MDKSRQKKLILASRGSVLALWQANFVADKLNQMGQPVEIKTWKTTGDIVHDRFLHEIGGKGLFIKELEDAMARGDADLAVHSLKDLPAKIPTLFKLAAVLKRNSHGDVIIFKQEIWKNLGIKPGAVLDASAIRALGPMTVATSSLRRSSLLAGSCPQIVTTPVRGNVDTRLKKLESEPWHAIILAEASLERLGIKNVHAHRLDPTWFIPCPGQGALAIEILKSNASAEIVQNLECPDTRRAVDIERRILARLGGDCTMPFGCLVTDDPKNEGCLLVRAVVLGNNGVSASAMQSVAKTTENLSEDLENRAVEELRKNGANHILKALGLSTVI